MATKEEVYSVLKLMHIHRPQRILEEISKQRIGYMAVLMFLSEVKKEVNSVDISKALEISSARMAVLLKKLEQKNLIQKKHSKIDARAIIIEITNEGEKIVAEAKDNLFNVTQKLIDEIGLDELKNVFENLNKINTILHENRPEKMEEHNV